MQRGLREREEERVVERRDVVEYCTQSEKHILEGEKREKTNGGHSLRDPQATTSSQQLSALVKLCACLVTVASFEGKEKRKETSTGKWRYFSSEDFIHKKKSVMNESLRKATTSHFSSISIQTENKFLLFFLISLRLY